MQPISSWFRTISTLPLKTTGRNAAITLMVVGVLAFIVSFLGILAISIGAFHSIELPLVMGMEGSTSLLLGLFIFAIAERRKKIPPAPLILEEIPEEDGDATPAEIETPPIQEEIEPEITTSDFAPIDFSKAKEYMGKEVRLRGDFEDNSDFILLPDELIKLIFEYLSPRSYSTLSQVCRRWYVIATPEKLLMAARPLWYANVPNSLLSLLPSLEIPIITSGEWMLNRCQRLRQTYTHKKMLHVFERYHSPVLKVKGSLHNQVALFLIRCQFKGQEDVILALESGNSGWLVIDTTRRFFMPQPLDWCLPWIKALFEGKACKTSFNNGGEALGTCTLWQPPKIKLHDLEKLDQSS